MRLLLAIVLLACGASSSEPPTTVSRPGSDPQPGGEASESPPPPSPAPTTFPTGPLVVECAGTWSGPFGPYDTRCDTAADCATVTHLVDCCGSIARHGIRASEVGRFEADEASCGATVDRCRCMAAPTVADDGSSQDREPHSLGCLEHRCVTWF
jgi:hypothetical protein